MRILLVNGSPRRAAANSRIVLDSLRSRLGETHEYRMVESMASDKARPEDLEVDFIVLAFPLYIDSLHSRLLAWLISYEALRRSSSSARQVSMIAVANCGFKEGIQNKTALDIVSNFCARAGIEWRGGLGIGTGEMIGALKGAPDEMPIKRPVSRALDAITARVDASPAPSGYLYATHALP
jgi:multimeric flavodoxin WrbA